MATFAYRAKDKSGNTVDGVLDAADAKAAAGMVREMGCWPLDIREQGADRTASRPPTSETAIAPIWSGVSLNAQAFFFRQLTTMLGAGMSLSEALDSLSQQRGMGRLPRISRIAAEHVRSGGMFSEILDRYPHVFSRLQTGLIKAGETGGMLDAMVGRVADYLDREIELRRKFSRITIYPKIVAVFIAAVWLFVPHVKSIIDGGWPVVGSILWKEAVPVLYWAAGIYLVLRLLLTVPPIRYVWDLIKISLPVFGPLVRKLAMSRFSSGLSVMYSAGVPLGQAVELSSDALGNEALRRSILYSVPQIRAGGHLSEALKRTRAVPEFVMGMITTGERTGSLSQVLDKVSEHYESESDTTIEKFGYILFAMLVVAAGIVTLMVLLNLYMSYAQSQGL